MRNLLLRVLQEMSLNNKEKATQNKTSQKETFVVCAERPTKHQTSTDIAFWAKSVRPVI